MNIFALDRDPVTAARWLCDKHISKMVVESGQMLANIFTPQELTTAPLTKAGTVWRHSHFNHPCSKWVRESRANAIWLCIHATTMENERIERGFKPHFSLGFILWCLENLPRDRFPRHDLTDFAVAINPEQSCRRHPDFTAADTVGKYRLYYKCDKPFATWKRNKPEWF